MAGSRKSIARLLDRHKTVLGRELDQTNSQVLAHLVKKGVLIPLPKYENCFLARTDPRDVARVESKTVISTPNKIETIPEPAEGHQGQLGHWMSPEDLDDKIHELFPGCMRGKNTQRSLSTWPSVSF